MREPVSPLSEQGEHEPAPDSRRWKALGLLAVAEFMVVLDATIVNIALPDIARGLHISPANLAWIITAYLVAFGSLLPLGGRLADVLGRRRMFMLGTSTFFLASLAAGLAPTSGVLIATRAVQGAGAALLAPAALSLVTSIFRQGPERTRALSIWGAVAAGGGAAGVLLGGLLTGGLGWRSVFLINVPVGVVTVALVRTLVSESRDTTTKRTSGRFDIPGALTVTSGLVALVVALSKAPTWGWGSSSILVLLGAAAGLLLTFVVIEIRGRHPLIPMSLFRVRTVAAGNGIMMLTGAAMLGLFYFLSLYEQVVLGYGPITAGLSQLPMALTLIAAAGGAAPLMARLGSRTVLVAGLVMLGGGVVLFGLAPVNGSFITDLFGPSLLVGIGLGLAFVPITTIAVAGVPSRAAGVAGGLINTSQQIGGVVGLAGLATLADVHTKAVSRMTTPISALSSGYSWAFYAAAAIALLGAVVGLITVRHHDGAETRVGEDEANLPATPAPSHR